MRKKVEGKEVYRNYGLVVIAFLVVMTVSILIFFDVIRENVNSNTRNSLSNYAGRQCFHLQSILEVQYEYMEGLASYIGLQEELTDEASMNLIRSVQKESYLEAVDQYLRYRRAERCLRTGLFSAGYEGRENLKRSSGQQTVRGTAGNLRRSHLSGRRGEGCPGRLLRSGLSRKSGF